MKLIIVNKLNKQGPVVHPDPVEIIGRGATKAAIGYDPFSYGGCLVVSPWEPGEEWDFDKTIHLANMQDITAYWQGNQIGWTLKEILFGDLPICETSTNLPLPSGGSWAGTHYYIRADGLYSCIYRTATR